MMPLVRFLVNQLIGTLLVQVVTLVVYGIYTMVGNMSSRGWQVEDSPWWIWAFVLLGTLIVFVLNLRLFIRGDYAEENPLLKSRATRQQEERRARMQRQ
ncbi:MAG: hypothetical protein AAGG50_14210 [Bacteroidota bacterium]